MGGVHRYLLMPPLHLNYDNLLSLCSTTRQFEAQGSAFLDPRALDIRLSGKEVCPLPPPIRLALLPPPSPPSLMFGVRLHVAYPPSATFRVATAIAIATATAVVPRIPSLC
eukprot:768630-Hanusia_phi.AAC.4